MTPEWLAEIRGTFAQIAAHDKSYTVRVAGFDLHVEPDVFSPKYFPESEWFGREVAKIAEGKRLLEIGTGTGIIAVIAGVLGDAYGIATDINPSAVRCANINFARHSPQFIAVEGNMYEPVRGERFDVCVWNHPFNRGDDPNESMLLRAGFDYQYNGLEGYIAGARDHADVPLLATGEFANHPAIAALASKHGYDLVLRAETELPINTFRDMRNRLMIYELKS